jgi:hypothetical protein
MAKREFLDLPCAGSGCCLVLAGVMIPVALSDIRCCGVGPVYAFSVFFCIPFLLFTSLCFSLLEGELPPPTGPNGKCVMCGYSLDGLPSPRCPECGHENVPSE